jgi:1-phosphofructokinase
VLIAGPNLTIDRTLRIAELRPGEVLRFDAAHITPGGKGLNVARVARVIGRRATLVGFAPGRTGAAVAGLIEDEGLNVVPVPVNGEIRSAAVILERSGRATVLNEPGPPLGAGDWERYEETVRSHMPGQAVLVASGSLPPGAPDEAYARLVGIARDAGAIAVVDSGGVPLELALKARPEVVCPNLGEAEKLLGWGTGEAVENHGSQLSEEADEQGPQPSEGGPAVGSASAGTERAVGSASAGGSAAAERDDAVVERALAAAVELHERGAVTAVVTAGRVGAALAGAGVKLYLPAPEVTVANPIGAGDALAAGLAASLEDGHRIEDAVAYGIACAAAVVEVGITGSPARSRIEGLHHQRKLERRLT